MWLLLPGLVLFITGRVIQVMDYSPLKCCFDSSTYAYRGDPLLDRGELVSFVGDSPRLWGAPALYALFDSDPPRVLAQWTIATVAWIALAWVLFSTLRTAPARLIAAYAVLLLGVQVRVASWDVVIITESLSVSLGILTLAMFIRWADRRTRTSLVVMTVAAGWWTFTRPEIRVFVVVLGVCLAWMMWRDRSRVRAALPAVLVLILAVGWCSAIMPTVSRTFAGWSVTSLSLDEETLMFRLHRRIFPEPAYKQVYESSLGMPSCPAMDAIADANRPMSLFAKAYRSCPEFKAWGEANAASSSYRFALSAPRLYLAATADRLPESVNSTTYGRIPSVVPHQVEQAFFPDNGRVLPLMAAGFALLFGTALAFGGRRHRLLLASAVVLATSAASLVAGLMYAGSEFGRLGLQEALGIRIAAIILLAVAVELAVLRWSRRATPDTAQVQDTAGPAPAA
ncbi:hypothetical protein AB0B31_24390 [Catellatospora citrea]|uniref:hypothetical protein n=1 Tax=Catellatospora citrea TaxID=53366 RepID=UPI0033D853C6